MKTLLRMSQCAALTAALAVLMAATASAGCRQAGGLATMITKDLAIFMSEAALKNAIANHGWKAAGPIKTVCKDDAAVTTTCTSRRRACD